MRAQQTLETIQYVRSLKEETEKTGERSQGSSFLSQEINRWVDGWNEVSMDAWMVGWDEERMDE